VICTGENSEFGKVFKMMQQQEVERKGNFVCNINKFCIDLGTKNTITKEYGCIRKTTFILFIEYYWFYCDGWMVTR
jgi:hypothetical protein